LARVVRLLPAMGSDLYWQMAFDEALLVLRDAGVSPDTLRFYWMEPSGVSIGYFQELAEAVDVDAAFGMGFDVTRRISGGGAVFHDSCGEIVYSIVVSRDLLGGVDVAESFRVLGEGVVRAVRLMGLEASFEGVNDIVVSGRKVSGQAQARRPGAVLQHGTLLYATDLGVMERVLRPPRKLSEKGVSRISERVATLSMLLGHRVSRYEALRAMVKGFEDALGDLLGVELVEGEASRRELELARSLYWKYVNPLWVGLR